MIFEERKHNVNLYNILLNLSRNIYFYKKIGLTDTFETRIYLMFFHFSILMIVSKKKGTKFDQKSYDLLFHNIENNLRELGFGDVSVNKKMKEFNKILYDILLKIDLEIKDNKNFITNIEVVKKYFSLDDTKRAIELGYLKEYFEKFFDFCFEQSLNNMLKDLDKFKL